MNMLFLKGDLSCFTNIPTASTITIQQVKNLDDIATVMGTETPKQ